MNQALLDEPDIKYTDKKSRAMSSQSSITVITALALIVTSLLPRSLTLLAPFIREKLGIDEHQFGILLGALIGGSMVTMLPIGSILDRLNIRRAFGTILTTIGIGLFIVSFQASFIGLILALFVIGMIKAAIFPLVNRVIAENYDRERKGRITGFIFAAIPLGGFLGALLIPILANMSGWRAGYYLLGTFSLIVAILAWGLLPAERSSFASKEVKSGFKSLKVKAFIILCIAYGLFVLSESTEAFMTLFLVDVVKLSAVVAGVFYGLIQLTGIAGRVLWGFLADRFFRGNRWWLFVGITGITAVSLIALTRLRPDSPTWIIALVMIGFGISVASAGGTLFTIIGDIVGVNSVAIATATVMFITSIADTAGPMLYSLLLQITGSYQNTLSFYIAITFITAIIFLCMAFANQSVPHKISE